MRKKITIQEIADAVGMSKYAVSRALSGKSGVSSDTRQYIVETAETLGYFTSSRKRPSDSLSHPKITMIETVLVLFPSARYQNTKSRYWGPVFNGISVALNQQGINILTLTEPSNDSIFSLLNPGAIQGIIAVGSIKTPILLELQNSKIPIVIIDHHDPLFYADSIFTDNVRSMQILMNELLKTKNRSYQFIGNINAAASFKDRWHAFKESLENNNIPHQQDPRLIGEEADTLYTVLPKMLKDNKLPDVFVCANDTYAHFAMETLQNENIIPTDRCLFTGFDHTYPELNLYATININKELIGKRAVDQLLWRISNPDHPIERKLIYADLILNPKN